MVLLLKMFFDWHTKRQVHEVHVFQMFITTVCMKILIKGKFDVLETDICQF